MVDFRKLFFTADKHLDEIDYLELELSIIVDFRMEKSDKQLHQN